MAKKVAMMGRALGKAMKGVTVKAPKAIRGGSFGSTPTIPNESGQVGKTLPAPQGNGSSNTLNPGGQMDWFKQHIGTGGMSR